MRACRIPAVMILASAVVLGMASPAAAQDDTAAGCSRLTISFQADWMSRTLLWDEETRSSRLVNPQALLSLGYQAMPGLDLSLLLGYSLASWDGLTFRSLPFSIENQAGAIGGPILGAEIRKSLFVRGYWELDLEARFTACLGKTAALTIEDLAVEGQADLKGSWMRIEAGPILHYRGFELFSPYVGVGYDRLWGRMKADEIIGDLEGSEEKKVAGAGAWALRFGTVYEPSASFQVGLGATLIPFAPVDGGLGLDYGATVRVRLGF
jgi:hypothetical protein